MKKRIISILTICFVFAFFIVGCSDESSGSNKIEQQAIEKALKMTEEHYSAISGNQYSGYTVSYSEPKLKSIENHQDKYFDVVITVEAYVEGWGKSDIQKLTSAFRLKLTDGGNYVLEGPPGYGGYVVPN